MDKLVSESDTLFLATPDEGIGQVWDCIKGMELSGKIICHFSGSLSSHVFSGIGQTGAVGCSIHPMYAFSGKFTSYQQFHTALLTLEGQQQAVRKMTALFGERLGHRILTIQAEDKLKYHAAAAMASNYMVGLFHVSLELLAECGFSEEESRMLLAPLVRVNVENMLEKGTKEALTGPIERNDVETVKGHLQVLETAGIDRCGMEGQAYIMKARDGKPAGNKAEGVYRMLGQVLASIAESRHPDRDYADLKRLLARETNLEI